MTEEDERGAERDEREHNGADDRDPVVVAEDGEDDATFERAVGGEQHAHHDLVHARQRREARDDVTRDEIARILLQFAERGVTDRCPDIHVDHPENEQPDAREGFDDGRGDLQPQDDPRDARTLYRIKRRRSIRSGMGSNTSPQTTSHRAEVTARAGLAPSARARVRSTA